MSRQLWATGQCRLVQGLVNVERIRRAARYSYSQKQINKSIMLTVHNKLVFDRGLFCGLQFHVKILGEKLAGVT